MTRIARVAVATAIAVALPVALAACGQPPATTTPGASSGDAFVTIRTNLDDAELVIDGHDAGLLTPKRRRLQIEPGLHQLELRHDDYFSAYAQLKLAPGEHTNVTLDLSQILP